MAPRFDALHQQLAFPAGINPIVPLTPNSQGITQLGKVSIPPSLHSKDWDGIVADEACHA